MSSELGHKATSGALWASIDRFSNMGLQFAVNLILARLLIPSDFGAIGMLSIFLAVSQCLIDGGFGSALIQKKNPTQTDFSTIFYWNLVFSSFLYAILFLCAPFVAKFFNMPVLSDVLRVIGINIILISIQSIQMTRLRKELAFRTIAITNLSSYILGATLAVALAYNGWGVWSLVMMTLCCSTLSILILWIITRWHPSREFSRQVFKELFGFGGYILAANVLQTICQNLQGIIIGRKFSATQMGYYSQAYKLDQITSYSIPQVIVQVMYPVYSSIQDDRKRLVNMLEMNIRVISFLIFPILGLLIIIAEPLIVFLYGEKWLHCVPYFRILCVGGLFVCLQNINFYAVAAVGKSRSLFQWSFYKWGFLLCALLLGSIFGMNGILWGMVLSSFNIYIVNAYLVSHHVMTSLGEQIKLLLPVSICFSTALVCSYILSTFTELNVILDIIIYIILYLVGSSILNKTSVSEVKDLTIRLIHR